MTKKIIDIGNDTCPFCNGSVKGQEIKGLFSSKEKWECSSCNTIWDSKKQLNFAKKTALQNKIIERIKTTKSLDNLISEEKKSTSPLILKKNEVLYYIEPSYYYEERSHTQRESTRRIRVAKGVSIPVSTPSVTETYLKELDGGSLIITNKRLVFMGNKVVNIPLNKVMSIGKNPDDIFMILKEGRQKWMGFKVDRFEFWETMLNTSMHNFNQGK